MSIAMYPPTSAELGNLLRSLAPGIQDALAFSERVFADRALPAKVKENGLEIPRPPSTY